MAFKAKDLQYDKSQPAFLQRLRGEIAGSVDDPDRQINPLARPNGPSRLMDGEDDGPTYVMEESNEMLSKAEYEALVNGEKDVQGEPGDNKAKDAPGENSARAKQNVVTVGGPAKKRKAAKIVGGEDDKEEEEVKAKTNVSNSAKASSSDTKKPAKKKKAKAIKLSFGDEDEDK